MMGGKARIDAALANKARRFRQLFQSELGKEVLKDLRAEMDPPLLVVPGDPFMTHFNVGKQDSIKYIDGMIAIANKADEVTK